MESTSIPNKIQVSSTTADLLIASGRMNWVSKRQGAVEAKGKGMIQTYWINTKMITTTMTAATTMPTSSSDNNNTTKTTTSPSSSSTIADGGLSNKNIVVVVDDVEASDKNNDDKLTKNKLDAGVARQRRLERWGVLLP